MLCTKAALAESLQGPWPPFTKKVAVWQPEAGEAKTGRQRHFLLPQHCSVSSFHVCLYSFNKR